jgi:hypothetical protein
MEEGKEGDDSASQGYRGPYSKSNKHSQQNDRQANDLLDERNLQAPVRRCEAAQHRRHKGCWPAHNGVPVCEPAPKAYHSHSDEVVCPTKRMRNSGAERIHEPDACMGMSREHQRCGQHNADQD